MTSIDNTHIARFPVPAMQQAKAVVCLLTMVCFLSEGL